MTVNVETSAAKNYAAAFTLIELSIVLVIIGLIVGGVLVGQDLIRAAEVRSQIAQVEKLNTAVNTFRGKFNAIPGDMAVGTASQFGFSNATCAGTAGLRDGNGVLEGTDGANSLNQAGGETGLFWNDLSSSVAGNLIDGSFNSCNCTSTPTVGSTQYSAYFLPSKLGRGAYLYVYSIDGINYYGMSTITQVSAGVIRSSASLSVMQAYNIDTKMDDGLGGSGNTTAVYVDNNEGAQAVNDMGTPSAACYDYTNGKYAISVNNGAGGNCALSFRFQ